MDNNGQTIYSLFALKFFCAIAVVIIHTLLIGKIYIMPLCRLAVPIFFMISGYFLVNDIGKIKTESLYKSIKKVLLITFFANLVYVLFYFLVGKSHFIQYTNIKWLLYEIFTGWGVCGHLWYLTAYLETLICLIVVNKYNLYKQLFFITPFLIILNLLLGSYSIFIGFKNPYSVLHTNFLVTGLPFVTIGMLIRKHKDVIIAKFNNITIIAWIVIAYLECLFVITQENYYRGVGDVFLFTPLASMSIFIYCLKNHHFGKSLYKLGRDNSLFIYLYHNIIVFTIPLLFSLNNHYYNYEAILILIIIITLSIIYSNVKDCITKYAHL